MTVMLEQIIPMVKISLRTGNSAWWGDVVSRFFFFFASTLKITFKSFFLSFNPTFLFFFFLESRTMRCIRSLNAFDTIVTQRTFKCNVVIQSVNCYK